MARFAAAALPGPSLALSPRLCKYTVPPAAAASGPVRPSQPYEVVKHWEKVEKETWLGG